MGGEELKVKGQDRRDKVGEEIGERRLYLHIPVMMINVMVTLTFS